MSRKQKFQRSDIPMKDRLLMNKFATVDEDGNTVPTKLLED